MASAPSQPILGDIVFGEGSANVSWIPVADTNEPPHNPGDRFLLEYRKAGMHYVVLEIIISFSLLYFDNHNTFVGLLCGS